MQYLKIPFLIRNYEFTGVTIICIRALALWKILPKTCMRIRLGDNLIYQISIIIMIKPGYIINMMPFRYH